MFDVVIEDEVMVAMNDSIKAAMAGTMMSDVNINPGTVGSFLDAMTEDSRQRFVAHAVAVGLGWIRLVQAAKDGAKKDGKPTAG